MTANHNSSNVVRLPSAARRKVEQRWNKHTRPVAFEMRRQWPGKYINHTIREKLPDAAALLLIDRSPELLLSIAIFEALDEERRSQVRAYLEMLKHTGDSARGAAAIVQLRTIGDQVSLDAAMKLLRGEG